MLTMLLHTALALALIESFGLAILLWLRAGSVPGMRYLSLFLGGVGVWILGTELPNWLGTEWVRPAGWLIALSPLTSAVFLHFVLIFCRTPVWKIAIAASYGLCGATTLAALILSPGNFVPWAGIDHFFMPSTMGWVIGTVWAALAIAGHGVMFLSWLRLEGLPKRQVTAMCWASSWGALSMLGCAFLPFGIEVFPYPLLLLPAYPLILVYGILRYQLMIVNAWARRALAWTLVVGVGSAAIIGLATLPLPFGGVNSGWQLWVAAMVTLLASGLLLDPFRRMASRIVYPGANLAETDIEHWRTLLAGADSFRDLEDVAARAMSTRLRLEIAAEIRDGDGDPAASGLPTLRCSRADEQWRTELVGWEAAPPSARYVAQLFGAVLAETAQRLQQAIAFAERERDLQKQERLAELGALAATVAHDIRNPLNIIAMAAAGAPAEVRQEIGIQTQRIAQLASDLLDYAKSWQIDRQRLDLADHVRAVQAQYPELEIGQGLADALMIEGDQRRLRQALLNLLDNARAALAGTGRIAVEADRTPDGAVALHICDSGPGIPAEIRDTLFQPFVSRSANGTGLGLAIVAKIMEAHGGAATVTERPGWSTCFTLAFPPPLPNPASAA